MSNPVVWQRLRKNRFDVVLSGLKERHASDYIEAQRREPGPSFTVIENVVTHHSYVHPYTEERSEEAVFRYMDDTAAGFIEALRTQGFFESGLLVVASGHRAMTMVSAEERQHLERAASSRPGGYKVSSACCNNH